MSLISHQTVSLREANQNFSRLMAAVERGEVFSITRRGREVARLVPSSPAVLQEAGETLETAPLARGTDIPLTDAALAERLRQLEGLVDKLLSALSPSPPHR
jgi:prevent-host-death family protein